MRGLEKNRMKRDKQTHRHTDGHRDSMIELAQWADSMKKKNNTPTLHNPLIYPSPPNLPNPPTPSSSSTPSLFHTNPPTLPNQPTHPS